ncbi:MAG TPA: hypothetical protein VMD06_05850 [Steroidobacteraceae bacterium]|nr:hypothetical protein [Steroidobacteraceae bacterium]
MRDYGYDTAGKNKISAEESVALERLLDIATTLKTHQGSRVADVLLAWWNGEMCGHMDLTTFWNLDDSIVRDLCKVLGIVINRRVYPDSIGYGNEFRHLVRLWRPELERMEKSRMSGEI